MNKEHIIKNICESSHIRESLVKSVIAGFGGIRSFKESASDVVNHGIDAGFGNFIYYRDTVAFTEANLGDILDLAKTEAEEYGLGLLEFIREFNCIDSDLFSVDDIGLCVFGDGRDTTILNALAWYAAEDVCRVYDDVVNDPHFKESIAKRKELHEYIHGPSA